MYEKFRKDSIQFSVRVDHARLWSKHRTKDRIVQQDFDAINNLDANGKPAGGEVHATGLDIYWQDGPLGRGEDRIEPNGAFVETVIAAAKQRIEHYQDTEFACRENALAITKLDEALHWLQHRTAAREARGVEGTHQR